MHRQITGLFVAEGSSDAPLADIVEALFHEHGMSVRLTTPDFAQLTVKKDVQARLAAGASLMGGRVDLVVVRRDADNVGDEIRRREITEAVAQLDIPVQCCPVIPIRMTEAWLLLDESAIRKVAGNPRGKNDLGLPKHQHVERVADPKEVLRTALANASGSTGRRHQRELKRFNEQRRQLLRLLDPSGPVSTLGSWHRLLADVEAATTKLS